MKKRTEGTDHRKSKSLINRCFLTGGDSRRLLSIGVSALLSVSTFLTVIPQMSVPVYAAGTGKNLQLGASALAPVMTSVQEQGVDPDEKNRVTTAQTVYYGSSGSQKWYVIGCNGNGAVQMPDTVTLFAKDNLETGLERGLQYHNTESNQYNGSYIKRVVDGYYNHVLFTGDEKAHIAERSLAHGDYSSDPGSFCDGISDTNPVNAFLWLLSTKEADLVGRSYRTANDYWWLRSPGSIYKDAANVGDVGNVNYSGFNVCNNYDPNVGVRPAFNINLSSIILTSAAEGGKSSGTTGAGALTAPDNYTGSEWKLTVNDTSRSGFAVNRLGSGKIAVGGNMRFNYSGAKKADNEYVSAILLDASGSLLAYGRIVNTSSSTSGTSYITLPSTLVTNGNTYTLQFISEQYHTDKSTDYSSSPSSNSITFTAGKGTPTAVDFNVELPTDTTYDGSQKSATVTAETGVSGMGNITVKYKDADNTVSTSAPTDPGTYQILLDVAAGTYYDAADNITDDGWTFTISTAGTVATPTFSPAAGTYATAQNVEISCSTTGATIHYTTDGSDPTISSQTSYSSAINVDGNMTIKAIAVKSGMTNSEIAEATYTISPSSTDHNITVENDGHGTGTATPSSASNDALIMLSATADDNYVFDRWTTEDNIRIINPGSSSDAYFRMIDEDVTVKANFKPETPTEKCTVTFDKNGGKGDMDDQTVDKGVRTQLNKNKFTRSGYSFNGWNTDPDGDGTGYEDKDYISVQKDITLYAQWERDDHEDDDEDEDDHTPASWILNPNEKQQLSIIFTGTPEGTCAGYQEQGAAAKAVFAAATPRGWSEAFEFNLLNKDRQPEMTLKKGTITLTIPSEYRKAGRQFALIALTKGGQTILLPDTDTNPNTVTATINVEGYAFALIYKD